MSDGDDDFAKFMTENMHLFKNNRTIQFPDEPMTEAKQCTTHRRYSKLSGHHSRAAVAMKFSMKVASHILQQNLTSGANNVICSPLSLEFGQCT